MSLRLVYPGFCASALEIERDGNAYAYNVNPHPGELWRISPDGNIEIYTREIYGDPLGAVVSSDGRWLYIAENGAIDRIYITRRD